MVKGIIGRFPPFHAASDALQLLVGCLHLIKVNYEAENSNLKEAPQGSRGGRSLCVLAEIDRRRAIP